MSHRTTTHFLIVYDHQEREQLALKTYTDSRSAVAAYNATEQDYEDRSHIEVVLLGADSEETIRITHPGLLSVRPSRSCRSLQTLPRLARPGLTKSPTDTPIAGD